MPWTTVLECSLHRITGWHPTTAFRIVYMKSSILFRDLSQRHLCRVSELQIDFVQEEINITHQLCNWQDDATKFMKIERLTEILERADHMSTKNIKVHHCRFQRMLISITPACHEYRQIGICCVCKKQSRALGLVGPTAPPGGDQVVNEDRVGKPISRRIPPAHHHQATTWKYIGNPLGNSGSSGSCAQKPVSGSQCFKPLGPNFRFGQTRDCTMTMTLYVGSEALRQSRTLIVESPASNFGKLVELMINSCGEF